MQQAEQGDEPARMPQPRRHAAQDGGAGATALEAGQGPEGQGDAGEAAVELIRRDAAGAAGGVVDPGIAAGRVGAFQYDEMIEVPEDDQREGAAVQIRHLQPVALGGDAVAARGAQDAGGLGAIAGDAAFHPQLFQRYPQPVAGQHHAERGGAAFGGFHLQHRGHLAPPPRGAGQGARHRLGQGVIRCWRGRGGHRPFSTQATGAGRGWPG
jgi:hypothetical protein